MKTLLKHPFLVLGLACLPAIYFLLRGGFYEPHDLHHMADIFQMYRAIASGQVPPRLGPDYLWGFGYPLFNLYYVLPFYIGAGFYALTRSLTGAFEFVFVLSAVASVVGMYLLLKEFFGKAASLAGSILYLYTPYRAVQIYVRGAMGEALSMAAIPFVFWAVARVINEPNRKNIALLAVFLAILILSHNYLWLLTAPWLVIFCLAAFFRKNVKARSSLKGLVLGTLLGAGISSFWWIPAVKEYGLVSGVTPFILADQFPFIKQLILPSWGYGASVEGPYDGMSFQIGIVNLAAVLVASGIFVFRRKILEKYRSILTIAFLGFIASALLMNIRTLPVWKLLPIYQFVQFPWRLLFLTTFFSAILTAFVIETLPKKFVLWAGIAVVGINLTLTWGYFRPSSIVHKPDDFYLSRMFATASEDGERRGPTQDYLNWSEDYLLLPRGVIKANHLFVAKIVGGENVKVIKVEKQNPIHFKAEVEADFPGKVTFYSLYFPGWYAKVDGVGAQGFQGVPYGQMEVIVPGGKHTIEFYWAETPLRKAADYLSLVSVLLTVALFIRRKRQKDATV